MTKSLRVALLATAACMGAIPDSWAQTADTGPIETIVVTAQKREQNPIQVPISLTAYSGKFLDKLGIQTLDKLSLYVPGLTVQNQSVNDAGFVIRGLTSDTGAASDEARVSVFQDGVSISQSRGAFVELFDIKRIEVAKGPQSTLFGRGALIGAINIVQNKAEPDGFAWSGRAEVGDYGYHMLQGMVNMPLDDHWAIRLAGEYNYRDGYTKNLLGGGGLNSVDTKAGRASLAWVPSESTRNDVIFNYENDTPNGAGFKSGTFSPTDPTTGAVTGNLDHNTAAALSSDPDFVTGSQLGIKRQLIGVTDLFNTQIDDANSLHVIAGWRKFDALEVFDPDGFSLPILAFAEKAHGEQGSMEFRINHDDGGPVSWFAGASYFHQTGYQAISGEINEPMALALLTGQISAPDPQPAPFFASPAFFSTYAPAMLKALAEKYGATLSTPDAQDIAARLVPNHQERYTNFARTTAYDFFGDATWHITPKLDLTGGVRYTTESKSTAVSAAVLNGASTLGSVFGILESYAPPASSGLLSLYAANPAFFPTLGLITEPAPYTEESLSDGGFTWRTNLRYSVDDNTSVYASYARGRRPEVLSGTTQLTLTPKFTQSPSETVDSYEIGAKTLTLDDTLRVDSAVYYYTYNNFQTLVEIGAQLVTQNAGKASNIGTEESVTWAPADWADIFLTYNYNHGRFDSGAYRGNMFRLTPDHKLSLGTTLSYEALGGVFAFTPSYSWQSKIFFDDDNDKAALQTSHILPDTVRDEFQRAYGLLDLHLTYSNGEAPWTLELFVSNATDQKWVKDAGNTGDDFGIPTFVAGEPRFYGAAFTLQSE
jgi:outer membrane receptor protein involved in Fe transport